MLDEKTQNDIEIFAKVLYTAKIAEENLINNNEMLKDYDHEFFVYPMVLLVSRHFGLSYADIILMQIELNDRTLYTYQTALTKLVKEKVINKFNGREDQSVSIE